MQNATYHIKGSLVQVKTGKPLRGLKVEAWHSNPAAETPAATTTSKDDGSFEMNAGRLPKSPKVPVYYFKVYKDNKLIRSTEKDLTFRADESALPAVIELDYEEPVQDITYTISGTISDKARKPLASLFVQASYHVPGPSNWQSVGQRTLTGQNGEYTIQFSSRELSGITPGALLVSVKVYDGEKLLDESKSTPIKDNKAVIDLTVSLPQTKPPQEEPGTTTPYRVFGAVRSEYGDLLNGLTVEVYDRDLRNEQLLGRAVTQEGKYIVSYGPDQFRRSEKGAADIFVKLLDPAGNMVHKSSVIHNAPEELELNINLNNSEYKGPSVWELLNSSLVPLLEGVSPLDLRENEQYQDISFLVGETGHNELMIVTWIICYQLAEKTSRENMPLDAAVFFGYFRQGQPSLVYNTLLQDIQEPDRSELLKDKILADLSELSPEILRKLMDSALSANLIPARIEADVDRIIDTLYRIKVKYAGERVFGSGKGTINQLLELAPLDETLHGKFMDAFLEYRGPVSNFWTKLEEEKVMEPEVVKEVKLNFELGALTNNYIPLVGALSKKIRSKQIASKRDLAKLSEDEWVDMLTTSGPSGQSLGVPANMDSEKEEDRYREYATVLADRFEKMYPTTAFAGKLARSQRSLSNGQSNVVRFLDNNPEFFLDSHRIDHYVAANSNAFDGIEDREGTVKELKTIQRVFKLSPTHKSVNAMMSNSIESAQQVYFMGQEQFAEQMKAAGVSKTDSKKIYNRAENVYAVALNLFGTYNQAINGLVPESVPDVATIVSSEAPAAISALVGNESLSASATAPLNTLPDLATLFGSLDFCECTHCTSVYSPASYFVDILRFLGERNTNGTTYNVGKKVKQVLLERRPDLGEIELSCENSNTPIPYIDLVNEILENAVWPEASVDLTGVILSDLVPGTIKATVRTEMLKKGLPISADAQVIGRDSRDHFTIRDSQNSYRVPGNLSIIRVQRTRQTHLSAAELRATPEYTNVDCYNRLAKDAVFPFNMPFNLWHIQTGAYLEHLGVPRTTLFETLQQKAGDGSLSPTAVQIDAAWLDMPETEWKIITDGQNKPVWDYWGLTQSGNTILHPDTPADPTKNITGTWLEVLAHVSVMLNRSGLSYPELMQIMDMKAVNPTGAMTINDMPVGDTSSCDVSLFRMVGLTQDILGRMHRFIRLWRRLGCKPWELDVLLPDTNPDVNVTDKQISSSAIQLLSRMNRIRKRFGWDWMMTHALYNNIDHTIYFDRGVTGMPPVETLYQRLFHNKIVHPVLTFPDSPSQLTGTIADRIPGLLATFRITEQDLDGILASLSLTVASPLNWDNLSRIYRTALLAQGLQLSIDHFLRLVRLSGQNPFSDPAATLNFIQLCEKLSASGFTIPELDYLLTHRYTVNSGVAIDDKAITAMLKSFREGMNKAVNDILPKQDETAENYIKTKLGLLPALVKDSDQQKALSIINGTWVDTPAENRNTLIDTYFTGVLDTADAKTKLAAAPTGLSGNDRFVYVLPALQAYLAQNSKDVFIRQKVAEVFSLELGTASLLLTSLQIPGSANSLLRHLGNPELLQKNSNGTYTYAIEPVRFDALYKSLRLLHKNALVAGRLSLRTDELSWWLSGTHSTDMGWPHPKDFPVEAAGAPLEIGKWIKLTNFFAWKAKLPLSNLTAFEFLDRVLTPSETDGDIIKLLARLMGWNEADITKLVEAFKWTVKTEFRNSASLLRLSEAMQAITRLGVNATRVLGWVKPEPTYADAESLKQTVKAKYDFAQWLQVIQPMQDVFREQKRNAMLSYLVPKPSTGHGQRWSNITGIYNHFLIDVEMNSCMMTSRLKQAIASAQLFVQRCLMNLELDIIAKSDLDSKWKQWKWMKYYRVWEANRKVFLYPENWIEPELRDEKSPFFKELESELMQNEVTRDTAEQAYLNYLEKLDDVSNLEIRSMFNEVISYYESVLHVIGRTRNSKAPQYYYRKRINGGRWTAWEKVDLEITSNNIIIAVHNRRLHLMWPQFQEKASEPSNLSIPSSSPGTNITAQAQRYVETRMFRSELKKGKWTPKILSEEAHNIYKPWPLFNMEENISLRSRIRPTGIEARIFLRLDYTGYAPMSDRHFTRVGNQLKKGYSSKYEYLFCPTDSHYINDLIRHNSQKQYFWYGFHSVANWGSQMNAHEQTKDFVVLQSIRPYESWTVLDAQATAFSNQSFFFFWDRDRSYFVDYLVTQYTTGSYNSQQTFDSAEFRFNIHYHPFVELFIKELSAGGIKGLLNRRIQIAPRTVPNAPATFDFNTYQPSLNVRKNFAMPDKTWAYPYEDVDFTYGGAYSIYNWELFYHTPFYIANKLASNQRFEEALEWFHYIFDPTNPDNTIINADTPQQKYWITRPFYETTKADYYKQKVESLLAAIAKGDAQVTAQVREWRDNPFNPHLIARMRTVAYQKNVLIKYIQTLIAWGDQLFRQNTIESINEATQLYTLADSVLGKRPRVVRKKIRPVINTFYQMEKEGLDVFGNALMQVENLVSGSASGSTGGSTPELPRLNLPYFGIPQNDKLVAMWDTVADRLFKIRNCMNIDGVKQQLPLFDPPIDPGMLVKATAAGLDMGAVLADMNAPMPLYRFSFLLERAIELVNEVKALGSALLSALERKDAEGFAQLRATHEMTLMDAIREVKSKHVNEATYSLESLQAGKAVTEEQKNYYTKLVSNGWNAGEILSFSLSTASTVIDAAIAGGFILAGGLKVIPNMNFGASGFGGSPHATVALGGEQLSGAAEMAVRTLQAIATGLDKGASLASTAASYTRRAEEWDYQKRLAEKQLPQIEKQIAAADILRQIAEKDLRNHETQIENLQKEYEYMRTKFTNQELYNWMVNQLSTVYFQSYQLAYDMAKRVERCFRYELGLSDSSYIQFGYWDSLKKGLFSGEKLYYDLKRLESAYYEQNRREYELTKHISLDQLDPVALMKLRQNGECMIDLPETIFDMDYPGHYFRRIKSVSLSIPCITGPYTTVACTLTLVSNKLRKDTSLPGNRYERDMAADDPRFRDGLAAIQSIATSSAQNDSGVFELNFRDERYLPFEGAGAVSTWQIKLNKNFRQFDLNTISDVVIHLNYTAREGGEALKTAASNSFNTKLNALALSENRQGLYRVFDLKREFPTQWQQFLHPNVAGGEQVLNLEGLQQRLPYYTRGFASKKARKIELAAKVKNNAQTYQVMLSPLGTEDADWISLGAGTAYPGLHSILVDRTGSEVDLNDWTVKIKRTASGDFKSLPADDIESLFLIVNYTIA
jgi:hypothetical protein